MTLCGTVALAAAAALAQAADDPDRWERWLTHDVGAVISTAERDYFLSLETDEERAAFVQIFWDQHDPTPGTPRNEFRDTIEQRVAQADRMFLGEGSRRGALSDRGKMWVLLGEPQVRREFHSSAYGMYPAELWFYQAPKGLGLPAFFYLIFFKRNGVGAYRLYHPVRDGPGALVSAGVMPSASPNKAREVLENIDVELYQAAISLDPGAGADYERGQPTLGSELLLAKIANVPNTAAEVGYLETLDLSGTVSTRTAYSEADLPALLLPSVATDGTTWVSYQLVLPPGFVTLTEREGGELFAILELDYVFTRDGRQLARGTERFDVVLQPAQAPLAAVAPLALQGKQALVPGEHDVSMLVRNVRSGSFGVGTARVVVPSPPVADAGGADTVRIEAAWIASHGQPLAGRSSSGREPFETSTFKLLPALDDLVAAADPPWLVAQVLYPASLEAHTRLMKTVTLRRGGEEVFGYRGWLRPNRAFDGGVLDVVEQLRLEEQAPGAYELTLDVADEEGTSLARRLLTYRVSDAESPAAWTLSRPTPLGRAHAELARQYLVLDRRADASAILLRALDRDDGAEARLQVAAVLLELGEAAQADGVVKPLVDGPEPPLLAHVYAALSDALRDRHAAAAAHYEQAIALGGQQAPLLNALGEAHLKAGNRDDARRAFAASLEVAPDQPEVQRALSRLGGTAAPDSAR